MAGSTPGVRRGGRQKGTPNKATVAREEKLAEAYVRAVQELSRDDIAAMSPLDIMLHAMKIAALADQWNAAAALAKEAAPYLHPKLSSETLSIRDDDSQRGADDIKAEIADIERRAAIASEAGTVAAPVPRGPGGMVH